MPVLKSACPGSNPISRTRTPYKAAKYTLAEQHPPVKGIGKIPRVGPNRRRCLGGGKCRKFVDLFRHQVGADVVEAGAAH